MIKSFPSYTNGDSGTTSSSTFIPVVYSRVTPAESSFPSPALPSSDSILPSTMGGTCCANGNQIRPSPSPVSSGSISEKVGGFPSLGPPSATTSIFTE